MTVPNLQSVDQQLFQQDEERSKLQIGTASDGTALYVRVSSDGYLLCKLMGYDVDSSGNDIQVIVDSQGRLRVQLDNVTFTGDIQVDTDNLEQLVTDQQFDYKMSDYMQSGNVMYVGYLHKSGSWIIKSFDISTGALRYAYGASGYDFTDPTSFSYDYYSAVF